jgi:hypothetical protein
MTRNAPLDPRWSVLEYVQTGSSCLGQDHPPRLTNAQRRLHALAEESLFDRDLSGRQFANEASKLHGEREQALGQVDATTA